MPSFDPLGLLRARSERHTCRRAAHESDEIPPSHEPPPARGLDATTYPNGVVRYSKIKGQMSEMGPRTGLMRRSKRIAIRSPRQIGRAHV